MFKNTFESFFRLESAGGILLLLAGVGFTMSLFISSLAFEETGQGFGQSDRLAIIVGSLVCGAFGYLVLKVATPKTPKTPSPG